MMFGQMNWGQPMCGYAPQMQMPAMQDQLAQLRAQHAAQNTPQQAQSGMIWVQGEAGAKSFLVAPGQHVQLMDSEAEVFYIKSADASGVPLPLRIFDYKERTQAAQRPTQTTQNPGEEYVTRREYDALAAVLAEAVQKINSLKSAPAQVSETPREQIRRKPPKEEEIDA